MIKNKGFIQRRFCKKETGIKPNNTMKRNIKNSAGFTIIELIVVIAIIAVLAAIVLVNVTQYIAKGRDAAIKGNLSTLATNAAVYYDDLTLGNGDFIGFSADTTLGCGAGGPIDAAITATGSALTCAETTTTGIDWCGCAQLRVDQTNYFCVDSAGSKKETATACGTICTGASPDCN